MYKNEGIVSAGIYEVIFNQKREFNFQQKLNVGRK